MNQRRIVLGIGGLGMALVALTLWTRAGDPRPDLPRSTPMTASIVRQEPKVTRTPEPPPELVSPELEGVAPPAEPGYWERLPSFVGGDDAQDRERRRSELLERTADFLSLDASRAQGFKALARQVVAEVDWAWCVRDASILRLSGDSPDEEAAIQEEYESRKRSALARFDGSLGEGPRAEEFRSRLDEWIDAAR